MRVNVFHAARAGLLALLFAGAACAQAPAPTATPPDEAPSAQASPQVQQQLTQPLNNKPIWDTVRSGVPQVTQVRGRETNVLVQPEGETWRAIRNGKISVWGGWGLVLILLAITAFYLWKGAIPLHSPRTGNLLRRFTPWERFIHWTTAICFVLLSVSGLIIVFGKNVLLPLVGYTLFSWLAILGKNVHNFTGPVFTVCTVLIFLTFVRDNGWRAYDWLWIRRFGGMMSGQDVPSGRFNAGEKLWFWFGVLLLGVIVAASGLVLDFPNFDQTRGTMQLANMIHLAGASLFMMMGLGHIYMGTLGMVGAYDAMRTGYVDETWAREHHEYWYNDMKARRDARNDDLLPPVARPA